MEVGLGVIPNMFCFAENEIVLILVLMEVGLGGNL